MTDRAKENLKMRRWRAKNKDKSRAAQLKYHYGITVADYDEMLVSQNGKCAICRVDDPGRGRAWHVDHCHDTGKVRGLLCLKCNAGLGMFKDNQDLLLAAHEYLSGRLS